MRKTEFMSYIYIYKNMNNIILRRLIEITYLFVYKSFIKSTVEVSCIILVGENKLIFKTPK